MAIEITDGPNTMPSTTLDESVASLSESFVQDEIHHEDQTQHMRSTEAADHDSLPGMFIPSSVELTGEATDVDIDENTLISAIIERFLARFALDVTDITVSLSQPKIARLTLQVDSVRFGSETVGGEAVSETTSIESRHLTINGARIYLHSLRESRALHDSAKPSSSGSIVPMSIPNESSHSSPSASSSTSGGRDDVTQLMSQSQFLPPPSHQHHLSASAISTSSLYESALMEPMQAPSDHSPKLDDNTLGEALPVTSADETLHAAEGVQPDSAGDLILALTDSLVVSFARSSTSLPSRDTAAHEAKTTSTKSSRISITTGAVPVLLRSCHIRDLGELALLLASSHDTQQASRKSTELTTPHASRNAPSIDIRVRGLVLVLLPSDALDDDMVKLNHIQFMRNPLQPTSFAPCFIRAFVDGIHATLRPSKRSPSEISGATELESIASIEITDASVFLHVNTESSAPYAIPILVVDSLLPDQYKAEEEVPPLPSSSSVLSPRPMASFDIIDWTDPSKRISTAKLSHWRVRSAVPSHHRAHSLANVGLSTSPPKPRPSVAAFFKDQSGKTAFNMEYNIRMSQTRGGIVTSSHSSMTVAAIHLFLDLSMLEETGNDSFRGDSRLLMFLDECMSPFAQGEEKVSPEGRESRQGDQHRHVAFGKDADPGEESRFRQQLLADLDLGYNYGQNLLDEARDKVKVISLPFHPHGGTLTAL